MYSVDKLYTPASIEEALRILKDDNEARVLAGGTDVMVKMRSKHLENARLLSINGIDELKGVRIEHDKSIFIGPMTTFTEIAESEVVAENIPLLKNAALSMGGPQIQNVATIGGNICNGAVSADSAPSLLALRARLVIKSLDSERIENIEDIYTGPGKTNLAQNEILTAIIIPPSYVGTCGCYIKFSIRKAMDLAITSAACVGLVENGVFRDISIALGVAAPTPIRCLEAEKYMTGRKPDKETLKEAGRLALEAASPRDSWRASKRYREALIQELTGRVIKNVYDQTVG